MTESTKAKIPHHLRRYIVDQNYARYTPEDQAVWRYIMRQLKDYLSRHAHESYLEGLTKTGICVERIPSIQEIDAHLEKFGWGAVPVSGFIPPAAFMEFQAIGVLPIASDMRTLEHLTYTPAPDIVHEAAGHAPILVHPEYAAYLRQYGEVARHALISKQDMEQYEAIRILSDLKEDPHSTPEDIQKAEKKLLEVNASMKGVSEAALLSRMNWWTAEYGLIGDSKNPKIFGAGLLSSVGESQTCLDPKVQKIPLSVGCVNYAYDITEPQPQLFVTQDFKQLGHVLEELAKKLSYRIGGVTGLQRALEAETVNTVQLNSGLQISGVLRDYLTSDTDSQLPIHIGFSGPSQLSYHGQQIENQGTARHGHGFSSPVGRLQNQTQCLSTFSDTDLMNLGLQKAQRGRLQFQSGISVEGTLKDWVRLDGVLQILTWTDCRVTLGSKTLFEPAWGEYDMAVGSSVTSVFAGPADRSYFGTTEDFVAQRVPTKNFSQEEQARHRFFQSIREFRENPPSANREAKYSEMVESFLTMGSGHWLPGLELLEIGIQMSLGPNERKKILEKLEPGRFSTPSVRKSVQDGLALADKIL